MTTRSVDAELGGLLARLDELAAGAAATPAWVERFVADALAAVDACGIDASTPEVATRLEAFAALPYACPQVVDVDDDVTLTRAVWAGGSLLLTFAPDSPDPDARTMFRLVRAESRIWYQTGIDGAFSEVTQSSMIVWLPRVAGDLEFVPGSY